jgi:glycosyltransferase involved in cell wall biosynthesis
MAPVARHILLLTDREWTHPQGGGTGTNLHGQVARWIAWGHRVTVIAGSYAGALAVERPAPGLTVHRMGTRLTVFPRAAWAVLRGLAADADVVLEVVNGISFLTPLWLRRPRVALVHHVHRDHYVAELGRPGAAAALLAETLPLKLLYRGGAFLTISEAGSRDLRGLGIPSEDIHVVHLGVDPFPFPPAPRAAEPRLLYLGRLKQYKRIEVLLDVLERVPGARLDVAGDGDHREALEAEIAERGLAKRVTLHGHVSEREKAALYSRAWVNLTASSAEGWCLTVMEAATCGTPSAALRVGGLAESIVDGETGLLADDVDGLAAAVARLVDDRDLRERLGAAARERARAFTWERTARESLALLESVAAAEPPRLRAALAASETLKAAGMAAATLASNAIALLFTVLFARILGAEDYGSLAALVSTFLILAVPGSALQVAVAREAAASATRRASPPRSPPGARASPPPASPSPSPRCCCATRSRSSSPSRRRGPPRPRRRPASCGCCSRSSAARCRACTPTGRWPGRSCSRRWGGWASGSCWSPRASE